jgi:guanine deaminase
MDQNSPDFYIESTKESIENTEKFINIVQEKSNGLAIPIVTPRFAPTCSEGFSILYI